MDTKMLEDSVFVNEQKQRSGRAEFVPFTGVVKEECALLSGPALTSAALVQLPNASEVAAIANRIVVGLAGDKIEWY